MSPDISYLITGSASVLVVHTPPASDYLGPLLKMQIPRLIEAMLNQNPGEYDSCTLMPGPPSDFYLHQILRMANRISLYSLLCLEILSTS